MPPVRMDTATAGFTLFELLVVLTIAAGIATIGLPILKIPSSLAPEAEAARAVVQAMRETRLTALQRNRPAALILDVEHRSLFLTGGEERQLPNSVQIAMYTAEDLVLADTRGAVRFYPDGSSSGGHIDIAGNAAERSGARISVDWLTGRIDVAR